MKAVIEFNYPEDERKLLFALKGVEMHKALVEIKVLVRQELLANYSTEVLEQIQQITDNALNEVH